MENEIEPFELERYFAKYEFNVKYLLCCADCESRTIGELFEITSSSQNSKNEMITNFMNLKLGYTESCGSPALREGIIKLYGKNNPRNLKIEDVFIHSGQEGILIFINSVLSPGDHCIVQWPIYSSHVNLLKFRNCEVSKWEMKEDISNNKWDLDFDWLKSQIKHKKTKAILVNSPHNPTGFIFSAQQNQELIQICADHNIILFYDEAYRFTEYSPDLQFSYFNDEGCLPNYDKVLSLNVLSKAFGLGGLRIGWTICQNAEMKQKMDKFKDYTTICSSTASEFLAEMAVHHYKIIVDSNLDLLKRNKVKLIEFFDKWKGRLSWITPQSGSIGFGRLDSTGCTVGSEEFCDRVLKGCGVLLLPSKVYDFGDRHFRVGFGRKDMFLAIDVLNQFLENNPHVFNQINK